MYNLSKIAMVQKKPVNFVENVTKSEELETEVDDVLAHVKFVTEGSTVTLTILGWKSLKVLSRPYMGWKSYKVLTSPKLTYSQVTKETLAQHTDLGGKMRESKKETFDRPKIELEPLEIDDEVLFQLQLVTQRPVFQLQIRIKYILILIILFFIIQLS